MSIIDRFFGDPERYAAEFINACSGWVRATVLRVLGPDAGQHTGGPTDPAAIQSATLEELVQRVQNALDEEKRAKAALRCRRSFAGQLTECFLSGRESPEERRDYVPIFVGALTVFQLLVQRSGERVRFAQLLLMALRYPMEQSLQARGFPYDRATELASALLTRTLYKRQRTVATLWAEQPPAGFGRAVAGAKRFAHSRALNLLKQEPTATSLDDAWPSADFVPDWDGLCDPRLRDAVTAGQLHILEALYPPACRLTDRLPNLKGQRLYFWLVLGGVSSKTSCNRRNRSQSSYLVQPDLIRAMKRRFGSGFKRQLVKWSLVKDVPQAVASFWETAKVGLREGLQHQRCSEEQLQDLDQLLGSQFGTLQSLNWLVWAAGLGQKRRGRSRRRQSKVPRDVARLPTEPGHFLCWLLFCQVGDHTFCRAADGFLADAEQWATRLKEAPDPAASVTSLIIQRGPGQATPKRELLAGVTRYLCEAATGIEYWTTWMDALKTEEAP